MSKPNRNDNLEGIKSYRENEEAKDKDEVEKPSFGKRMASLRDRLKLGPHHKMERFIGVLGIAITLLFMFTALAFANYRGDVKDLGRTQALFTSSFKFSLSDQGGTVEGIYGNPDKTDVSLLIKFSNPSEMSMNAENYQMFITGDSKSLKREPDVTFAIFGATGYGVIRFQDEEPMEREIMQLTLRANKILSGDGESEVEDVEGEDNSFNHYDQANIYINPGADGVQIIDDYKTGEADPVKLYTMLVADEVDKKIKSEIESQTKALDTLLKREREYEDGLVASGYIPPERPWFIKGDYIDDEGVLRPAKDLIRAHDFDYWSKTIHDGYLNQVVSDLSEYDDYIREHTDIISGDETDDEWDARVEEQMSERIESSKELEREDGTILVLSEIETGRSVSHDVTARDTLLSLEKTWQSYVTQKGKLQRSLLEQLIVLDADVQSQSGNYSEISNENEEFVFYY